MKRKVLHNLHLIITVQSFRTQGPLGLQLSQDPEFVDGWTDIWIDEDTVNLQYPLMIGISSCPVLRVSAKENKTSLPLKYDFILSNEKKWRNNGTLFSIAAI